MKLNIKVGDVFRKCRSIKDIENKFAEFEYNETGEQIDCVVCNKLDGVGHKRSLLVSCSVSVVVTQ